MKGIFQIIVIQTAALVLCFVVQFYLTGADPVSGIIRISALLLCFVVSLFVAKSIDKLSKDKDKKEAVGSNESEPSNP